jgi:hypothetical protein
MAPTMTMTTEHLVDMLDTADFLSAAWRDAFLVVPRHAFLPAKIWMDDGEGEPQPINRGADPDRWLESAYANVAIVTQFDDGATVWPASVLIAPVLRPSQGWWRRCWIAWTCRRVSEFSKSGPALSLLAGLAPGGCGVPARMR